MKNKLQLLFVLAFAFSSVQAQLVMPKIFSNDMVLQRNQQDPIWGTSKPGANVTVQFMNKIYLTKADGKGKWSLKLPVGKEGGPYLLKVSSGSQSVTYRNVLVGDIWLCSGQSNMEMPLEGWPNGDGTFRCPVNHSEYEIANAQFPKIRLLQLTMTFTAQAQNDVNLVGESWRPCSPQTVRTFSSTAYFFAREVYKKTGIPIGLIESSVGGSTAELWTSPAMLKTMDDFKGRIEGEEARGQGSSYSGFFNGMIAPLIPFGIKGVIWYQGEFSASRAYQYKTLFPKLIKDWRDRWQQGNFPFYYVQLPIIDDQDTLNVKSEWAELREAQLQTLAVSNTAMAVTIDLTDNDLHPANKQDYGLRLAMIALNKNYGKNNAYTGPLYQRYEREGNVIRVFFSNPEVGLKGRSSNGLFGFYIAGKDKKFYRADAKIEGQTIVVNCKNVSEPVSVRYAWADNPFCNLFGKDLIPASPFRTDDWEMVTRGKK
jgi:sialate O-acetylesterase